MVLDRLERLTLDESRVAAAQMLEVVHGLAKNLREVLSSERVLLCLSCCHRLLTEAQPLDQGKCENRLMAPNDGRPRVQSSPV
jgi:hypothetical protein